MAVSKTDRISKSYYTNIHTETELNSDMLMQDLYQTIVRVYGSSHEIVNCSLVPENHDIEQLLKEFLPSNQSSYNDDLDDVILKSIQYIAGIMVHRGFIVLELVTQTDLNGIEFYSLENVYGTEIKIDDDYIFQIIPDDAAAQLKITEPIKIPRKKCFIIDFPKELGGKNKHLEFLAEFKALGKQSPMLNFIKNPLYGKPGYDSMEHQKIHDLELWKKSKMFYWHHRGGYEKYFSGYYSIYRRLMFKKSQIILRDHIIENLKKIVTVFSEKIGNKIELKIDGLITIEKVDKKISKWNSGQINPYSINEVL
ncbi:MAG: hypothetical protein WC868_00210 [Bacteroidales bacterium]